jgi:hypothetical protein
MIVIDAENQSIGFHEKFGFKTVGIIKESGYKFDRWFFYAIDFRIRLLISVTNLKKVLLCFFYST